MPDSTFPALLRYPKDSVTIRFTEPFKSVLSFDGIAETVSNPSALPLSLEYRYSYDGQRFSAWLPLSNASMPSIMAEYDKGSILYLEAKYTRAGTSLSGTIRIEAFSFDVTYLEEPECSVATCESDNVLSPENSIVGCSENAIDFTKMDQYKGYQRQLNSIVAGIHGQCVMYFKTKKDARSRDIILHEYSLLSVFAKEEVTIVVPDGNVPSAETRFTSFDLDFSEMPWEVHVPIDGFKDCFKKYCDDIELRPEKGDYIYFPLTNRLYDVESSFVHRDFLQNASYYKVYLVKHQRSANRLVPEELTIDPKHILSFDSMETEVQKEVKRVTKPLQYSMEGNGGISKRDSALNPAAHTLSVGGSMFSKYYYPLPSMKAYRKAVEYSSGGSLDSDGAMSFSCWARIPKESERRLIISSAVSTGVNTVIAFINPHGLSAGSWIALEGFGASANGRHSVLLVVDANTIELTANLGISYAYNPSMRYALVLEERPLYSCVDAGQGFYVNFSRHSLVMGVNSDVYELVMDSPLSFGEWYGICASYNAEYSTYCLSVWKMPYQYGGIYSLESVKSFEGAALPASFALAIGGSLWSQKMDIANVRLFSDYLDADSQRSVITQFVVKDSDKSLIADNCLPDNLLPKYTAPS